MDHCICVVHVDVIQVTENDVYCIVLISLCEAPKPMTLYMNMYIHCIITWGVHNMYMHAYIHCNLSHLVSNLIFILRTSAY